MEWLTLWKIMKTINYIFYKVFNENFNGIVLFHDENFNTIEIGLRDELDYDN
jgi:hypothetical protein